MVDSENVACVSKRTDTKPPPPYLSHLEEGHAREQGVGARLVLRADPLQLQLLRHLLQASLPNHTQWSPAAHLPVPPALVHHVTDWLPPGFIMLLSGYLLGSSCYCLFTALVHHVTVW